MSVTETTYIPNRETVMKKNQKWYLASALLEVWHEIHNCKDKETKEKIIKVLLHVL